MRLPILLAVAAAAAIGPAAHGAVLFDNLGAASDGSDSIVTRGPIADSFSTGTFAGPLATVSVLVGGPNDDSGSVTVSLLSDAATSPGSTLAVLGSIPDAQLSDAGAIFTFAGSTPLSAGTRYWIQLSSSDSNAQWFWSSDISGPGVANEFFANTGGVYANSDGPYQMQVTGGAVTAAVPEPASWPLMLLGLGLAGGAARRRRALAGP